jgi:parallel beta-helix repeat protein
MERRWKLVVAITLAGIVVSAGVAYLVIEAGGGFLPFGSSIDETHILIEGNDRFTPANGVISGSGTATDPYVISLGRADFSRGICIDIVNTTAPFRLQDSHVTFYDTNGDCLIMSGLGIRVSNATDFIISNVSLSNCCMDILNCRDFVISSNPLWVDDGVTVTDCSDFHLMHNTDGEFTVANSSRFDIRDNVNSTFGISTSRGFDITNNTMPRDGITLCGCSDGTIYLNDCRFISLEDGTADCRIIGNTVRNSSRVGICLDRAQNVTIDGNTIQGCALHGIELWNVVKNCTVVRNNISDCYSAIVLRAAEGCIVYHNNIFSARHQNPILDEQGWCNSWDAGYPEGGNYYFDYAGSDDYSGVDQDESGPDGIGDTPVIVYTYLPVDPGVDHYPLVAPYPG